MIIDADGAVLGRLASLIAKKILMGEDVVVVNAGKIIISGKPKAVKERFLKKIQRGDPHKGPFYPRYPDKIFIRCVRGMIPYKKQKGKNALKRLKVYSDHPEEFKNTEKIGKSIDKLLCKHITLKEISKSIGAKHD